MENGKHNEDLRAHGRINCYQDSCENVPFACVGGLEARTAMQRPYWIKEEDAAEYFAGYIEQAIELYGEDWQTCSFSWRPALTIE